MHMSASVLSVYSLRRWHVNTLLRAKFESGCFNPPLLSPRTNWAVWKRFLSPQCNGTRKKLQNSKESPKKTISHWAGTTVHKQFESIFSASSKSFEICRFICAVKTEVFGVASNEICVRDFQTTTFEIKNAVFTETKWRLPLHAIRGMTLKALDQKCKKAGLTTAKHDKNICFCECGLLHV